MRTGPGEPVAGPWRVVELSRFASDVTDSAESRSAVARPGRAGSVGSRARPLLVAVDGRGGAGKSTLAGRLQRLVPGSAVVHTDDVAWWHSRFGWQDLLIEGVLRPVLAGDEVRYLPPGWRPRGRPGFVEVPAGVSVLFVEGVGASRRELTGLMDAAIWVQSDFDQAEVRGLRRDVAKDGLEPAQARREWDEWMAEEIPFLSEDRPWERAGFVVAGTPVLDHDPETQVVIAQPLF